MDIRDQQLLMNVLPASAKQPSTPLSLAKDRLRPAAPTQIAVELEKLRAVFGYEEGAWKTAVGLYMDALADLPHDLLAAAVITTIQTAGAEDRFPKPGQLRALALDGLEARKSAVRREESRASRAVGREEWPKWLEELWGPLPDGPRKRNEAMAVQQERYAAAKAWREAGGITRATGSPHSAIAAAQIAAGLRAALRMEPDGGVDG